VKKGAAPLGVFDSGVGGLTVVAAIRSAFPGENLLYLGDTARVPYGGRSQETIVRYSREISGALLQREARALVVACNTASALALETLQAEVACPLLGVVSPGAAAAVAATRNGRIGIIGTRATIRSHAYDLAIQAIKPGCAIYSVEAPLLVPLIEEGLIEDPLTDQAIHRYLQPMLEQEIDTLVLACTHYPLLGLAIQRCVGPCVRLVNSADNTAKELARLLPDEPRIPSSSDQGKLKILLTDPPGPFLEIALRELQLSPDSIEIIPADALAG
jgi:glutamate racemase